MLQEYLEKQNFFNEKATAWRLSEDDHRHSYNILATLGLGRTKVILDVGCGTGVLFPIIRQLAPQAWICGLDLAYNMLYQQQSEHPDGRTFLLQAFGEKLPLKSSSVDLVLNFCVFPHLIYKRMAISEYHRVLKPGGRFVIIHHQGRAKVNHIHRSIGAAVGTDLLPAPEAIQQLISSEGLKTTKITDQENMFLMEATKYQ
jgi:demethylmenaquinone methyltransferase/2-methoxy-6-polyprenyl-1,4-benzoquinol methylase